MPPAGFLPKISADERPQTYALDRAATGTGYNLKYEPCPESKDTKVLNMYNIFNLQKRHCK